MRRTQKLLVVAVVLAGAAAADPTREYTRAPPTREEANALLLGKVREAHRLTDEQAARLQAIFAGSDMIGQGNPAVTVHPMTEQQCRDKLTQAGVSYENPRFDEICGGPYMAPLYDPDTRQPEEATACIDQFEFPDIPCEYPVTWVKAIEAAEICEAMGKRICDAHEWEGACAGALQPPDYRFDLARGKSDIAAVRDMRNAHNRERKPTRSWAYGPEFQTGICAQGSFKTEGCSGGSWKGCGTNTFPVGAFPGCTSRLQVYDIHGNAAEHMNLPLAPDEMSSTGSEKLGVVEMKGSWFIWDSYYAHEDWCRWRAPYWHGSRLMIPESHRNYHLGFRCCKTVESTNPLP